MCRDVCKSREQTNWDQAYHWPGDSGWRNSALDSRMERNWRVVMTVANSSAP